MPIELVVKSLQACCDHRAERKSIEWCWLLKWCFRVESSAIGHHHLRWTAACFDWQHHTVSPTSKICAAAPITVWAISFGWA